VVVGFSGDLYAEPPAIPGAAGPCEHHAQRPLRDRQGRSMFHTLTPHSRPPSHRGPAVAPPLYPASIANTQT
jgi:hypothetical protein